MADVIIPVVCLIAGMVIGGVVCFFIASCIVVNQRHDENVTYQKGYNAGYIDGLNGEANVFSYTEIH